MQTSDYPRDNLQPAGEPDILGPRKPVGDTGPANKAQIRQQEGAHAPTQKITRKEKIAQGHAPTHSREDRDEWEARTSMRLITLALAIVVLVCAMTVQAFASFGMQSF